jgi:hypothetical protein
MGLHAKVAPATVVGAAILGAVSAPAEVAGPGGARFRAIGRGAGRTTA